MNMNSNKKRGVTLVEIAIVLAVIGLLLGGILKGQELINNAKVRSIADRQGSLKAAWFAFIDRYQALPGDFIYAAADIPGAVNGAGIGLLAQNDSPLVFQHLTAAGYLRCPQCTATVTQDPSAANSLQNQYGGIMAIWHDGVHHAVPGGPANQRVRLAIHTGPLIPSNIIAEVDRKLDDGIANTGDMVFSTFGAGGQATNQPDVGECVSLGTATNAGNRADGGTLANTHPSFYRGAAADPPVEPNCGAAIFI